MKKDQFSAYLRHVSNRIHRLNEGMGKFTRWISVLLLLLIVAEVGARYLFRYSSPALNELEWHLFALLFLLASAYTLRRDKHVRVDVLYSHMSEKHKAWVNLLGTVFFLMPFCYIVVEASIPYVKVSFLIREHSSDLGGLPARYLIKGSIVIGFVLLILQGVALALDSLCIILGEEIKKPSAE